MLGPENKKKRFKDKIVQLIRSSLDDLCQCEREKHIQDILGSRLNCSTRKTLSSAVYPDTEIDLLGDDYIVEIKYNDKYYSGFDQILAQRILYSFEENYIIHMHEYLDQKFVNGFSELCRQLDISGILINKRKKKLEVIT
jgi:hypothetical protein